MPENRVWFNGESQEEYITAFAQELVASLFYYDDQFDKYLHDPAWTDFTLATPEIKKAKALLVKARALGLLTSKND